MIGRPFKIRTRYSAIQKKSVQDAIFETIDKNGIVVSCARTPKEICETLNYNRSIEIPICVREIGRGGTIELVRAGVRKKGGKGSGRI